MKIIESTNLPRSKVTICAIGESAGESIKKLELLGIKALIIKKDPSLPDGISSHSDLRLLQLGGKLFMQSNEHLFGSELSNYYQIINIREKLGNKYPADVPLNCAVIGKKIICNPATASKQIISEAQALGLKLIKVNQGYTKCSVVPLNDNAIITDDEGIYKAAEKEFKDVTLIDKGSVSLNGYNYGFIGGCCGMINKNTIAFNGELASHSSCKLIEEALKRNFVTAIELKKGRLEDIGGIIPLLQEEP